MRCKICHLVIKRPAKTSKDSQTCFQCRKQIEIVQVIKNQYKQTS